MISDLFSALVIRVIVFVMLNGVAIILLDFWEDYKGCHSKLGIGATAFSIIFPLLYIFSFILSIKDIMKHLFKIILSV